MENFGTVVPEKSGAFLRFLYNTSLGRVFLKPISAPIVSRAVGSFLETRISRMFIPHFVKSGNINTDDYVLDGINSFNDFFCREIKPDKRSFDLDAAALCSPCDGLLSVYKITDGAVFPVKQGEYTVASLLKNDKLASEFDGGYLYVLRLCVNHYHRYAYPVSGQKGENVFIKGVLNTVRPVALMSRPVFCENSREYTVIDSAAFGKIVQMEVGALLVGKIDNYHGAGDVQKGAEKGRFLYGGSTVILLSKTPPYDELLQNTQNGLETDIQMGERLNK